MHKRDRRARFIGSVGGDRSDVLIRWDLFPQVGQHRSIADVACHCGGLDCLSANRTVLAARVALTSP